MSSPANTQADNVVPIRNYSPELKAEDREWFTGPEVCVQAGITYRQLDHWTRTGLLVPDGPRHPGQGTYRPYSASEVAKAKCVSALLRAGLYLPSIRKHIHHLTDEGLQIEHGPVSITYIPENQ